MRSDFWTPERDELLKLMWEAGLSQNNIALNIGDGCTAAAATEVIDSTTDQTKYRNIMTDSKHK